MIAKVSEGCNVFIASSLNSFNIVPSAPQYPPSVSPDTLKTKKHIIKLVYDPYPTLTSFVIYEKPEGEAMGINSLVYFLSECIMSCDPLV